MRKDYLFTPGPTMVPPEVLLAMAQPVIHHRTAQFSAVFEEVNEGLKYLFQTTQPVLTFAASGTGAMEAAVANLLRSGEKALVVRGGKFGERWAEICQRYGIETVNIDIEWGRAVSPGEIEEALAREKGIKVVFTTHCETSTAVRTDIEAIARITRERDVLLVVDAVSALGAEELRFDAWGIDAVVSGAQKGIMLPPGLAFIALSERAQLKAQQGDLPNYYFSIPKALKSLEKQQTPYTPAVSLIIGLRVALGMIRDEGLENVWKRHALLAEATRAGLEALGLKLFSKAPSNVVTAFEVPEGIEAGRLRAVMRERYGANIAGGQAQLKDKICRIAHLGYMTESDTLLVLNTLELALRELGYACERGAASAAAVRVFESGKG